MSEGTVVTFYSYKGGVGRTMALANIGALLSLWGHKVLCIDWDIEAPGLQTYFRSWLENGVKPGLVDLITEHIEGRMPKWRDYLTEVPLPGCIHPLKLMIAGTADESYATRMQSIEWAKLYDNEKLGFFIETLRDEWKGEFNFILIDSRTGITDISGICTVQLPDLLVTLFTANHQSLEGTSNVVDRIKLRRTSLPFDRAQLLVLPVISRFELRVEYEKSQEWLNESSRVFKPLYSEWLHSDISVTDILNFTRIPSIPYWSFGEKLPVIEKGTNDPEDIGYWIENLAILIADNLSSSKILFENRGTAISRTVLNKYGDEAWVKEQKQRQLLEEQKKKAQQDRKEAMRMYTIFEDLSAQEQTIILDELLKLLQEKYEPDSIIFGSFYRDKKYNKAHRSPIVSVEFKSVMKSHGHG
jgi:cellulose biosynthesis protein BcsQ